MLPGKSGKILVVDDDKDVLFTAKLALKGHFERVDTLHRPGLIPESLASCQYDVVLLDLNFARGSTSGKEGLEWIRRILQIDPRINIITTTAYGEINLAVQVMKHGAADFLVKPWNKEQLVEAVRNAIYMKSNKSKDKTFSIPGSTVDSGEIKHQEIISRSPVMACGMSTACSISGSKTVDK